MDQSLNPTEEWKSETIYEEWLVSGWARQAGILSGLSANNALHVTLTRQRLTVTANLFLMRRLIRTIGLELSIPVTDVIKAKRLFLRRFEITYRDQSGSESQIILAPWRPQKFEEALNEAGVSKSFEEREGKA